MIVVAGTLRLPPERLEIAKPHMQAMIEGSSAEAGCLFYTYAQDLFDPALFHVIERWRDREALMSHFQTPHMMTWRAAFAKMGLTDRDLVSFEAGEPTPL